LQKKVLKCTIISNNNNSWKIYCPMVNQKLKLYMKKHTNEERKGSKFIIIVTSSFVYPDILAFLYVLSHQLICMSDQFIG
jgi:hypothetical protein